MLALTSNISQDNEEKLIIWNSDSLVTGDQHTSAPISNDKRHFISLCESNAKVIGMDRVPRGIVTGKGKLELLVEDDEGIAHT